jgi:hypothetical protein
MLVLIKRRREVPEDADHAYGNLDRDAALAGQPTERSRLVAGQDQPVRARSAT